MNEIELTKESSVEQSLEKNIEETQTSEIGENGPTTELTKKQMMYLMNNVKDMMGFLEAQWNSSREEFKLTDTQMKLLFQYNSEHGKAMPDDLSPEDIEKWDKFNGLDSITAEKVLEIFGEDHPIIGVDHTQTIDRLKSVSNDLHAWTSSVKEYREVHDAYMQWIEDEEEREIQKLIKYCNDMEDSDKKKELQKSIDLYYNRKYLHFLAEPLSEESINRLVKLFSDGTKIKYLIERSREKLSQLKISAKFILEISQFEKRFLSEEYHKHSNILLLYFMNTLVYSNISDPKSKSRGEIICMVYMLDKFIRNTLDDNIRTMILNNVIQFEKQFVGKLPEPINQ